MATPQTKPKAPVQAPAPKSSAPRALVEITDGVIASMAGSSAFVTEFPFLKGIPAMPVRRCNVCQKKLAAAKDMYEAAKAAVGGMASDRKQKLKSMLNAVRGRVKYKAAGGREITLTF